MVKNTESFDARLDIVPAEPGVYLMKDATGSIIYVGKALNLQNRLRSYFCAKPQGTAKTLALISHIADYELIVCGNELEAFILENNLIKEHQPKYNILLRDDKEYPYIRVTCQEEYPRVLKSFHVLSDKAQGARYFGPYLGGDLFTAMNAISQIFPLKRCKKQFPRDLGKERPCLNYHLGLCLAPCRGEISQAAYAQMIAKICQFLEGKNQALEADLEAKMQDAAEELRFEEAQLIKERILALRRLNAKQVVSSATSADNSDLFALAQQGGFTCIQVLRVREGRLIGSSSAFFSEELESSESVFAPFIQQYYDKTSDLPAEIIVNLEPAAAKLLQAWFKAVFRRQIKVHNAQRGHKKSLLELARQNAKQALERHTLLGSSQSNREQSLANLGKITRCQLNLQRLEAYDVANMGADDRAVSMVVFVAGRPERKAYRHFAIKTFSGQNDPACLQEALCRRLQHLDDSSFAQRPQLILVDGAQAQLTAVRSILAAQAPDIALAAMVKDEKHRTSAILLPTGERIPLKGSTLAGLEQSEQDERLGLLRLVTAIQNEAHRFAGNLQRKLGQKRKLRWSLEAIPGVGSSRRKLLFQHFGSLKKIAEASLSDLLAVPGLPQNIARKVYEHYREEG